MRDNVDVSVLQDIVSCAVRENAGVIDNTE
jgi:hypothetical protein